MRREREQDYLDLIGRVAKLDHQAAMYLRYEARELYSFSPGSWLLFCFEFLATPQGEDYWYDLSEKLGEG